MTTVVAFIDLLGFTALIERMEKQPDVFDDVYAALKDIETAADAASSLEMREFENWSNATKVTTFSDSVVISASGRYGGESVTITAGALAASLLYQGILCRGGISSGWLVHEDNVVLGKALIEAYRLESGVAHFPRIVVADDVASEMWRGLLKRDEDGRWIVDVVGFFVGNLSEDGDTRNGLNAIVEDGLRLAGPNPRPREKWEWMKREIIAVVKSKEEKSEDEVQRRVGDESVNFEPRALRLGLDAGVLEESSGGPVLSGSFIEALDSQSASLIREPTLDGIHRLWEDLILLAYVESKAEPFTISMENLSHLLTELVHPCVLYVGKLSEQSSILQKTEAGELLLEDGVEEELRAILRTRPAEEVAALSLIHACEEVVAARVARVGGSEEVRQAYHNTFLAVFLFHYLLVFGGAENLEDAKIGLRALSAERHSTDQE